MITHFITWSRRTVVLILSILLLTTAALAADTIAAGKCLAPYFVVDGGDAGAFPLQETAVDARISGVIAAVTVTQKYRNTGEQPLHAAYVFPASTRAAVHALTMKIGERTIQAEVMPREAAKTAFETAKKEGKSASLLEQQRPNVFTMKVANILPGDAIEVRLEYTEFLTPTEGIYEFVFPTVVGPRYSNQPAATADESDQWVQNPYFKAERSWGEAAEKNAAHLPAFHLSARLDSGLPIQEITSPSHRTDIAWEGKCSARVEISPQETIGGNRDFILRYRLAGNGILSGLMLYRGEKENFFLLMVQPPARVQPADIPPREYIFVVDVSGSMNGFPLNTSKALMNNLLRKLRPVDRFNILLFEGESRLLAPNSLPATPENIDRAAAWVTAQEGGGGTEMLQALKRAFALPNDAGLSRQIVIATDGYVSFEADVFRFVRANLNQAGFFAFGIGESVNRYLIEGMARAGYGEAFVVTNAAEAERQAARFVEYIQSPVLTGIQVTYDGFRATQVEPGAIPDLFASRPLVIFGKWEGEARGTITVKGRGGSGEYRQTFDAAEVAPRESHSPLRYLWARTRIAALSDHCFVGNPEENREEIVRLGLAYNLLTRFTSFVAVDKTVRNPGGAGRDVNQPSPLPHNVSDLAVGGGEVGSAAEPELIVLILFAIALTASGVFRRLRPTLR